MEINFEKENGLIPTIVQNTDGKVLMLAYSNQESLQKTIETKKAHFFSRSRNRLWMKGEESGNEQIVKDILVDCDDDAILFIVEQTGGAACHTGYESCFYRNIDGGIVGKKIFDPDKVYK